MDSGIGPTRESPSPNAGGQGGGAHSIAENMPHMPDFAIMHTFQARQRRHSR